MRPPSAVCNPSALTYVTKGTGPQPPPYWVQKLKSHLNFAEKCNEFSEIAEQVGNEGFTEW